MVCDVCKALCSDHVMTYCRKKWMCPDCFQKWQKSPDAELPASRPAPDWLDCPLVSYEIRQPRDYPMANPFRTLLEWFGIDESTGYAVVAGCLYGSAGTGEDLEASFKRAIENKYILLR